MEKMADQDFMLALHKYIGHIGHIESYASWV
jgi:hypothetical protein